MRITKKQAEIKYKGVSFIGDIFYIKGGAEIHEGAVIYEGAIISEGAKSVKENIVIHGIGDTQNITAYRCSNRLRVCIGYFEGTLKEAEKAIESFCKELKESDGK
jgi:hypothetical protein